jgi:2-haloacid dehalogenase
VLERRMLDETLRELGVSGFSAAELARLSDVWTRLDPWPDSPPGLARLKRKYTICTLSNGSVRQLAGMAKKGNLPWDVIFSVEMFRAFKPDPKVYLGAAEFLQLQPSQVMMVAAHPPDLRAAKAQGLGTAYVPRPDEWGSSQPLDPAEAGEFDILASSFEDLATKLRC